MTSPTTRYYSTAQAAQKAGIARKTLLEWLQKGWVPKPERDWRGWRVWTDRDIEPVIACKNKPRPFPPRPRRPVERRRTVPEPARS